MKKSLIICFLLVVTLVVPASAQVVISNSWTVNAAIPEGSLVGISDYHTVTGLGTNTITDVIVELNISGGFNGGLVGYLTFQDANGNAPVTETLLSQIGTSPSNPLGSSGAGFNVILSDGGTINGSIHNATGIPTGIWQPDSTSTFGSTFGGIAANGGTWTLFLADLAAGGGTSTLNSWSLTITETPEPSTFTLVGLGLTGIFTCLRRKK